MKNYPLTKIMLAFGSGFAFAWLTISLLVWLYYGWETSFRTCMFMPVSASTTLILGWFPAIMFSIDVYDNSNI